MRIQKEKYLKSDEESNGLKSHNIPVKAYTAALSQGEHTDILMKDSTDAAADVIMETELNRKFIKRPLSDPAVTASSNVIQMPIIAASGGGGFEYLESFRNHIAWSFPSNLPLDKYMHTTAINAKCVGKPVFVTMARVKSELYWQLI